MPNATPLFIHPLLGANDLWCGYLVESPGGVAPGRPVLEYLLNHPDFTQFDPAHPWFIPSQGEALPDMPGAERLTPLLPAVETPARSAPRNALVAVSGVPLPAPGEWDFIVIRAGHARTLPYGALAPFAGKTQLVATDVMSHADHEWVLAHGCQMSTGEFMLSRSHGGKKPDITRIKLLELLALITNDADTAAIEAVFRQEAKLAYSLLRLVNSAANAPRTPIQTFAQAINLLGRRQLQRWLQLLVYADPNNGNHANPLLLKAAARGRLMELLAPSLCPGFTPEAIGDAAFMVGSFSLLDVLLHIQLPEVLQHLPVPTMVRDALLDYRGPLGALLKHVCAAEGRDYPETTGDLVTMTLSGEPYLTAQITALAWASNIRTQ